MANELWHAKVYITQIPAFTNHTINDGIESNSEETDMDKSWLFNPFMDNTVYGTEFTIDSKFSWAFFLPTLSKSEAYFKGNFMLNYLKDKFKGLDGKLQTIQINSESLNQNKKFFELRLPRPNQIYVNKVSLITKFMNLYYHRMNKKSLSMYILWQIDDSISARNILSYKTGKFATYMFKVRVFFSGNLNKTRLSEMNLEDIENLANLSLMTSDIQTELDEGAKLIHGSENTWYNILTTNVFWQNDEKSFTGACYEKIYDRINLDERPCFLSANVTDFTMLNNIPLPRASILENENVNFNSHNINYQRDLHFGKYVHNGVLTQIDTYIPQDNFAQSVLIAGQQGTGKTYFLRQIMNEFYNKALGVGILVLNLAKGNQEKLYSVDKVIKYGSPEFQIPYFIEGQYKEKCLQETASYLIASLGLKNIVEKNMLTVMKSFYYKEGLPNSLKTLFLNLQKFFKENPYHDKFQTNILRAINNRILSLLSDPILKKTIELTKEFPIWIKEWLGGKKVFLDLSMCNIHVKRLLSNAIFQMVRALLPDRETGGLNYLIVIDEAHQILGKSISNNPDDDDYIAREQLEKIFADLMKVFRSRGLSFILADQEPNRLFNCISTLPSLKFLFRLGYPDNALFSGDRNEQNFLSIQRNRYVLILNGITGERFIFRTLNI